MNLEKSDLSELARIADGVLAYDHSKSARMAEKNATPIESWSVPVTEIFANTNIRLDATYFDPKAAYVVRSLRNSGLQLSELSDLARVELRSQFTRIWAQDRKHGIPYFNATDLLSLFALGEPGGGLRYLSHATDTNIDSLVVREGWLLMTCSGTIGRVFYVPRRLDGWVATHDLIRIIANDPGMTGYLYAWLRTPTAQAQILRHTHGGQIDHVTDNQVAGVLVPHLPPSEIQRIHTLVSAALLDREKAIENLNQAWPKE